MKKKLILASLMIIATTSMVGCGKKSEDFESKVSRSFSNVTGLINQLNVKVEDLEKQVDILKTQAGISSDAKFTSKDINFSSVKVLAKEAKSNSKGEVQLPGNSEFNLSIDVMNSTDENLSQLTVQAYVTYYKDGKFLDRHLVDSRFDVMPKSVRKQIKFEGIPVKDASIEHQLTIHIKDVNGNTITTFEKKIYVK